jgi:hypothetical protein
MNKLISTIEKFRSLGFFKSFDEDTAVIAESITTESESSYFGNIRNSENEPIFEQIILSYDKNISWFIEDTAGYDLSEEFNENLYIEVFAQLSRISKGLFIPQNLEIKTCGFCEGRDKRIALNFTIEEKEVDLIFCADGWSLILNFLEEINLIIEKTSHSFEYTIDAYGAYFVFLLHHNQKKFLSEEFKWNFVCNTIYWADKALYYKEINNPIKAEECFKRAIIKQNDINSIVQYAIFLKENSRNSEAISIFELGKNILDKQNISIENRQWWLDFIDNQIKGINKLKS